MRPILICLTWASLTVTAAAGEVGFIEDFALARDRAASLRQLIPGTEDYYYYHCLHYLNTEQFEKAERARVERDRSRVRSIDEADRSVERGPRAIVGRAKRIDDPAAEPASRRGERRHRRRAGR